MTVGRRPTVIVAAPMLVEARALRHGLELAGGSVVRSGVGPRRTRRTARTLAASPGGAVAVAGLGGALVDGLEPGVVVVADRVLRRDGSCVARCSEPELLASAVHGRGLPVRVGAVVSVRSPAIGATRRSLGLAGALVADMESVWLAAGAAGRPFAAVRVVMDSPARELTRPWRTVSGLRTGLSALPAVAGALAEWGRQVVQRPEMRN